MHSPKARSVQTESSCSTSDGYDHLRTAQSSGMQVGHNMSTQMCTSLAVYNYGMDIWKLISTDRTRMTNVRRRVTV